MDVIWSGGRHPKCPRVGMFRLRLSSALLHSGSAQHDTVFGVFSEPC
jgi:hypothetical protein